MKTVEQAIYMSIFGAVLCMASCGRNNNRGEGAADSVEDTINAPERDKIDTEMDSLVSPDTVMPAP